MKTINETFTEREFILLVQGKNNKSWHDFILEKCLTRLQLKELKGGYKDGKY